MYIISETPSWTRCSCLESQRTSTLLSLCRGLHWKSALNSEGCHTASNSTSLICLILVATRRKHLSLCYFDNIVNGIHVYPNLPIVPHSPQHMLHNAQSYMQFSAHTNYFQHYFFPHVTAIWNSLPSDITSAPPLSVFMNYIHFLQCFYGRMYHISVLSLFMCPLHHA